MLNGLRCTEATELSWGTTDVGGFLPPVDVVLMADVAYEPKLYAPLVCTVAALCSSGTLVLHAYTARSACRSDAFFDELSKLGYTHEEVDVCHTVHIFQHHPPRA